MNYDIHTLPNGIRLIHYPVNSPVAHCGIMVNTGSRDETDEQHGIAHFIEHMVFKGTAKRKAHHILSRMEDVGGEINAYTTKEETCLQTTFFNNYYDRAFDMLSDILFRSNFPAKEIIKEKDVIIDEINSYKDSPSEQIYDDFEELIFQGNPIARNILGTHTALEKYTAKELIGFYTHNYPTSEMVVSSVSNIPFKKIVKIYEKYFAEIPEKKRQLPRLEFNYGVYKPIAQEKETETYQAHCIIGNLAYSYSHEKRLIMHLLNNLLGGPGMNTRLNMTLRENRGLAYNVESNYATYSDVGIAHIYFGTDKKDLHNCIDLTKKELKFLREKKLGTLQLARAKKQLTGQIAIGADINENQMLSMGRSLLIYNKVDSLDLITAKIEDITSEELQDVANEVFEPNKLSQLVYL